MKQWVSILKQIKVVLATTETPLTEDADWVIWAKVHLNRNQSRRTSISEPIIELNNRLNRDFRWRKLDWHFCEPTQKGF